MELHSKVLQEANKWSNLVTKIDILLTVSTAVGYCLVPIVSNFYYHLIKGGPFLELLPTKTAFPYNMSISPNYELTYILICVAIFLVVFSSVSVLM